MKPFNTYDIGDSIRCSISFLSLTDTLTDPNAVFFHLLTPSGVAFNYTYGVDPEVGRLSTGMYYLDWVAKQQGAHYYRFEASGTIQSAEETYFIVRSSAFY